MTLFDEMMRPDTFSQMVDDQQFCITFCSSVFTAIATPVPIRKSPGVGVQAQRVNIERIKK